MNAAQHTELCFCRSEAEYEKWFSDFTIVVARTHFGDKEIIENTHTSQLFLLLTWVQYPTWPQDGINLLIEPQLVRFETCLSSLPKLSINNVFMNLNIYILFLEKQDLIICEIFLTVASNYQSTVKYISVSVDDPDTVTQWLQM